MENLKMNSMRFPELVNSLLKKNRRSKKELAAFLDITPQAISQKLRSDSFNNYQVDKMAEFFDVTKDFLINASVNDNAKESLEEVLTRIENSWKVLADEKEQIISQQRFIIETMQSQLAAALGKEYLSEDVLPVILDLDSKKIKKMPVRFASVPMHG